MKKLILLGLLCFFAMSNLFAQTQVNTDSVAYQNQRKKINQMLAARKLKFGQYSQSLSQHTGIFGFQTKDDIRRSSSILMDIAKTDDNIFKELKILFEYSAFQQRQIQDHSKEAETISQNYAAALNKLKQRNAQLKADLQRKSTFTSVYIIVIVLMLASILYLLYQKNKAKV
jgi:cell division protein FtsB